MDGVAFMMNLSKQTVRTKSKGCGARHPGDENSRRNQSVRYCCTSHTNSSNFPLALRGISS